MINFTVVNNLGDYSLYCDKVENALGIEPTTFGPDFFRINYIVTQLLASANKSNFNDYLGLSTVPAISEGSFCKSGTANIPCTNNYCVLRYGNNVIIATSLNRALNISSFPLQEAVGFNKLIHFQDPIPSTGENIVKIFESPGSGALYYSAGKQVIFYTITTESSDVQLQKLREQTLGQQALNVLLHPIQTITNFIKLFTTQPQNPGQLLDRTEDFDRIYFARKGAKSIVGIQETKFRNESGIEALQTFISINYTGFTQNICALVNASLGCNATGNSQYIFTAINATELDKWVDLTAKVRIKD